MVSPNTKNGGKSKDTSKAASVNQESQSSGPSPFTPPSISLPKGGGAIRGMGEKFAANPVTGSGFMSVPIATSPGRSGFGPQLSLSYDSGSGNGLFGFGWSHALPSISRKTDKGCRSISMSTTRTSTSSPAPRTWYPSTGATLMGHGSPAILATVEIPMNSGYATRPTTWLSMKTN